MVCVQSRTTRVRVALVRPTVGRLLCPPVDVRAMGQDASDAEWGTSALFRTPGEGGEPFAHG